MQKGSIDYKTSTGRKIVIDYYINSVPFETVPTNKKVFEEMCKSGCKNYNNKWSCPPCSPDFNKMKHKKNFIVIMISIDSKYFNDCKEWSKVRAINVILKSKMDNIVKELERISNGYCYISGACRLCKICAKKENKPCKHPDKLRYSLESVGIDCNKLSEIAFGRNLCWYKEGQKYFYGSALGACETDSEIDVEKIVLDIIKMQICF